MDINKISNEIATLKRAVKTAATASLKDKLKKKIVSLNEVLKDANIPAKRLAMILLGAKRKVFSYTTAEFNAVIKRLSYKAEYSFLKGLTKPEIKDDLERYAKNPGWRFKGRGNYKTPTKKDLAADAGLPYSKRRTYYEKRSNRSDVTNPAKLKDGGGVGENFKISKIKEIVEKYINLSYNIGSFKILRDDKDVLLLGKENKYKDISIDFRLDMYPNKLWFGGLAKLEVSSVSLADPKLNYLNTSDRRVVHKKINVRKVVSSYLDLEKLLKNFLIKAGELDKKATGGGVGKINIDDLKRAEKLLGAKKLSEINAMSMNELQDELLYANNTLEMIEESGSFQYDRQSFLDAIKTVVSAKLNKKETGGGVGVENENKEMETGGWIGTKVYRKLDKKEFKVNDFKNYGSYQELFVKSNDGEKIEITLGHPYKKNDFLNNWSTNKMETGGGVEIKEGEDYLYGRVVGKNYTYTNNKIPNFSLKIGIFKEGKSPNNHYAYLSVPNNVDASILSNLLNKSGSINNSNNSYSNQFSRYDLSEDEVKTIINHFTKISGTKKMGYGGLAENENKEMVLNNAQQIEHHAEELENAAKNSKHVPAWVVAKIYNASSNISDATHYLEGVNTMPKEQFERIHEEVENHKMETGGGLDSFLGKQMHVSKVCKTHGCSTKDYLHAKKKYKTGGVVGSESEKFIKDLEKFRGSAYQLPWMWLWQFCQEYPNLVNSKFANSKPINPSYFDDVVKKLDCKFGDIAITGERLKDWNAIKKEMSINDFEKAANKAGINYVIGGYNVNDCILWNAKGHYKTGGIIDINELNLPVIRTQFEDEEYEFKEGGKVKNTLQIKKGDKIVVNKKHEGVITNILKTKSGTISYKWKMNTAPNDDQFRLYEFDYGKRWVLKKDKMEDGGDVGDTEKLYKDLLLEYEKSAYKKHKLGFESFLDGKKQSSKIKDVLDMHENHVAEGLYADGGAVKGDYEKIINFIKYEVDYVPDSVEEIKKYPEPYKTKALEALKYRENNFNEMAESKKIKYMTEGGGVGDIKIVKIKNLEVLNEDFGKMTYNEALEKVKKLGGNWRLPSIEDFFNNSEGSGLNQNRRKLTSIAVNESGDIGKTWAMDKEVNKGKEARYLYIGKNGMSTAANKNEKHTLLIVRDTTAKDKMEDGGGVGDDKEIKLIEDALDDYYGIDESSKSITSADLEKVLLNNKYQTLKYKGRYIKTSHREIPKFNEIKAKLKSKGWVIYEKQKMKTGGAVKGAKFKHHGKELEIKKVQDGAVYTTDGKQYSLKVLESLGVTFNKERAKSNKPRGVRGNRREQMEGDVAELEYDLKGYKQDLRQLNFDMELEAGEKGDKWTDADANRYGREMNELEEKIKSLEKQIAEKEQKLSYKIGGEVRSKLTGWKHKKNN